MPILCSWSGIDHPYCMPAYLLLILVYALLFFVVARFGERMMHALSAGYHLGRDKLSDSINQGDAP